MHILIPSLFANAWTQPLVKFLQSQGATTPLAACSVVALLFHIPNNWYVLVYEGRPRSQVSSIRSQPLVLLSSLVQVL